MKSVVRRRDAGDITLQLLLLLACVVLLTALGLAGADWFIHGHKSLVVALAGFAAACWVASALPWPPRRPRQPPS